MGAIGQSCSSGMSKRYGFIYVDQMTWETEQVSRIKKDSVSLGINR